MLIPQVKARYYPCRGVSVQSLRIPERHTWGRSAEIDLKGVQARLLVNNEIIQRSFHPAGLGYQPPEVKSGESLPDWLKNQSTRGMLPILACNALHTNFVRGNGFVMMDGRLVCKPQGTIPIDGDQHEPLEGMFTALVLYPDRAQVRNFTFRQGALLGHPPHEQTISGPLIVDQGQITTGAVPVRLPPQGQTVGNEINFSPDDPAIRTSFTAFGIGNMGQLLVVSIFAGRPRRLSRQRDRIMFQPSTGDGLTLYEMADLMIHLGANQAILGGGSGDTQQFVRGSPTWCGLPRLQASRDQLTGTLRGLGVILAAVYMLWMFQRVMFGEVDREENRGLKDLNLREGALLLVMVFFIIQFGVYPKPYIDRIEPSLKLVLKRVEARTTAPRPAAAPIAEKPAAQAALHASPTHAR
jgi:hypothetical protein